MWCFILKLNVGMMNLFFFYELITYVKSRSVHCCWWCGKTGRWKKVADETADVCSFYSPDPLPRSVAWNWSTTQGVGNHQCDWSASVNVRIIAILHNNNSSLFHQDRRDRWYSGVEAGPWQRGGDAPVLVCGFVCETRRWQQLSGNLFFHLRPQ